MMTGAGPFGALEMGGMFMVVKVREGLARNDYNDPGWYQHPPGTVAWEWTGAAPTAARKAPASTGTREPAFRARKPAGNARHHE
jgi:hypothetical protein